MDPRTRLPSARLHRVDGQKPVPAVADQWARIATPVRSAALQVLSIGVAFAPLVAVVALAIGLLWSAGMSGSP